MIPEPEELKAKASTITIGLVITAIIFGAVLGFNYAQIASQSQRLEMLHQFALDEVGGLRSDMDKEDKAIRKEIEELKQEVRK